MRAQLGKGAVQRTKYAFEHAIVLSENQKKQNIVLSEYDYKKEVYCIC